MGDFKSFLLNLTLFLYLQFKFEKLCPLEGGFPYLGSPNKRGSSVYVLRILICKQTSITIALQGVFKFCDISAHLDVCPKTEVSCELNCGVVMCREVMTQHLEVDCLEKAIECPYAKYKCVGLIKRKDMSKHLEERRMEHLELKLNNFILESSKEFEIIANLKEKISEQSATIETMSQKIQSLEKEMKNINSIPRKLKWIAKLPEHGSYTKTQFIIAGYHLEFSFFYVPCDFKHLQIRIYPQNGCYYEELKWPFKAEFTTRLRSKQNPTVTNEFKSKAIVIEGEDFNSNSKKSFTITTFRSANGEIEGYLTDGAVEFEMYVIFI